jgi:16S rRNA processing protein RimM
MHNFGAGDLIEVRPAVGRDTIMLPFTQSVVPLVDIAGGRIVVAPPAGAFEAAGPDDEGR